MDNEKDFLEDIDHRAEGNKFKRELLQRCRRLKSDGYTDREIVRNLQKEKKDIANDRSQLKKELTHHTGRDNPISPQKKIENLFIGQCFISNDPPKAKLQDRFRSRNSYRTHKKSLQAKLEVFLKPQDAYQYKKSYKGIMDEFNTIADGLGADKSDRSEFESFLNIVFDYKRRLSVKSIEWYTIKPLIAKIRLNGLDEVVSDNSKEKLTEDEKFRQQLEEEIKKVIHKKSFEPKKKMVEKIHQRYLQKDPDWEWQDSTDLFNELGDHKEFKDADDFHNRHGNWKRRQKDK